MKVDSLRISKVFSSGGDVHYVLPYFQREYAWEKENWQTLLNDVIGLYNVYSPDKEPEHFMGSLVVINDGTRNGTVPAFKLVDGQQRLTTISIMLCVLREIVAKSHPNLYKKIHKLLINGDEENLLFYKILPTKKYGDRSAYQDIISGGRSQINSDSKIPQAYDFFHKEIETRIINHTIDPEKFFLVLTNCLHVVFIDLNQEERPYEIFESLNHKGKPLSQADLVRNYIAMKLPEIRQTDIFENYWSKIEDILQEKRVVGRSRLGELTAFLRHYLAFRSGVLCNEEHVYERFRDRIENEFNSPVSFEKEIAVLKKFAEFYNSLLRPEDEKNKLIKNALLRLSALELSTAYPFFLGAFDAVDQGKITNEQMVEGCRILENFLVRRFLVGEPTNQLNKVFPNLWREIDTSRYIESVSKALVQKNYPSDYRIRQSLITESLYDKSSQTRSKTCLILDSINKHLSDKEKSGGYTVLRGEPTIEHIMPQTLNTIWKEELGLNYEQVFEEYLNTIGNLTIVTSEWNSQLSNASFVIKKQKLANHALLLNSKYFSRQIPQWNEQAMRERAEFLTEQILEIWPALGEPPTPRGIASKPKFFVLLGETVLVNSWRDVAIQTTEKIISVVDNFNSIAEQLPAFLDREQFPHASRQLSNGWWLNVNLSAASIRAYCKNLINASNLSEDDWQVEEE